MRDTLTRALRPKRTHLSIVLARLGTATPTPTQAPRKSRKTRALAVGAVVVLAAVSVWALGRGGGGGPADTTPFDEALAELASAPAARFTTTIASATMDLKVTATGHGVGTMSFGSFELDMLIVDGRLFTRIPSEMLPLPPFGSVVPMTGRWITLAEEVGAAIRSAMAPGGMAVRLSGMLAGAEEGDDLDIRLDRVGETPAVVASMPQGDLYVTSEAPHRILRFVPMGAPPVPEGGGAPPAPPAPELPDLTLPEPPPSVTLPPDMTLPTNITLPPDMTLPPGMTPPEGMKGLAGNDNGNGGGSGDEAAAEHEDPSAPADHSDHSAHQHESGESQEPVVLTAAKTATPVDQIVAVHQLGSVVEQAAVRPQPQPQPEDPTAAPIEGIVGAQFDVDPLAADDASVFYADLQEEAGELGEAVDSDVLLFPEAPQTTDCGATDCTAEVSVEIQHANRSELETGLKVMMVVGGQDAGSCSAEGVLPASGTASLSCTNSSPEYAAAQQARSGSSGTGSRGFSFGDEDGVEATAEVVPHAVEPEEVTAIGSMLEAEAGRVGFTMIEDSTPTEEIDTAVEQVAKDLGIDNPSQAIADLYARAEAGSTGGLTEAHVRNALTVIARLPVDRVDQESAKRVVELILAAGTPQGLVRLVNMLEAVPAAVREAKEGTKVVLDVGGGFRGKQQSIEIGGKTFDLSSLGLSGRQGQSSQGRRRLDIALMNPQGDFVAWQVIGSAEELTGARLAEVNFTAIGVPLSGPDRHFNLVVADDQELTGLFEPKEGLVVGVAPVAPIESLIPAAQFNQPATHKAFTTTEVATRAIALALKPDGTPVLPESNRLRSSNNGVHAEELLESEGDLLRAAETAAELGTPEQPARVLVAVTKAPCPDKCVDGLGESRQKVLDALTEEQRANIDPRFLVVTRHHYQTNREDANPTTVQDPAKLAEGGWEIKVFTVDGAVTPSGQIYVEAIMAVIPAADRARPITSAAPAPTADRGLLPASGAKTVVNALDGAGATLRLGGNQLDAREVAATARAAGSGDVAPTALDSLSAIVDELGTELHQQQVCP